MTAAFAPWLVSNMSLAKNFSRSDGSVSCGCLEFDESMPVFSIGCEDSNGIYMSKMLSWLGIYFVACFFCANIKTHLLDSHTAKIGIKCYGTLKTQAISSKGSFKLMYLSYLFGAFHLKWWYLAAWNEDWVSLHAPFWCVKWIL